MQATAPPMTARLVSYDEALSRFARTGASFGGGLSNHGPMAVEALVSMGAEQFIGPFVEEYSARLDEQPPRTDAVPEDWRGWLAERLPSLVPAVANAAGHGLLRTAHAVRGIERAESEGHAASGVRLRELVLAVEYWAGAGAGLSSPDRLTGAMRPGEWASSLRRLPAESRPEGLLTRTLRAAARTDGFEAGVASLDAGGHPSETLDALASASAELFLLNEDLSAFALLHGTTVSTMARCLLDHLGEEDARRLEAAVAGFVAAAVIGFDDSEALDHWPDVSGSVDMAELPRRAALTLDDHTIKFTDACLGVFNRTGNEVLLRAADHQIVMTSR